MAKATKKVRLPEQVRLSEIAARALLAICRRNHLWSKRNATEVALTQLNGRQVLAAARARKKRG